MAETAKKKAEVAPSLPSWIKQVKGFKCRFILDPDLCYPLVLDQLAKLYPPVEGKAAGEYETVAAGFSPGAFGGQVAKDQYWLEVCHQIFKVDAVIAIKNAGLHNPTVATLLIVKGSKADYKSRWALKAHPAGGRLAAIQEAAGLSKAKSVDDGKAVTSVSDKRIAGEAREHFKLLRGYFPA